MPRRGTVYVFVFLFLAVLWFSFSLFLWFFLVSLCFSLPKSLSPFPSLSLALLHLAPVLSVLQHRENFGSSYRLWDGIKQNAGSWGSCSEERPKPLNSEPDPSRAPVPIQRCFECSLAAVVCLLPAVCCLPCILPSPLPQCRHVARHWPLHSLARNLYKCSCCSLLN